MYPLYSKHVQIYKGRLFAKPKSSPQHIPTTKVIVLDLDETIGSFHDLFILWQWINPPDNNQTLFDKLLDLYPEFLRHGILSILEYLAYKKSVGECSNLFLYTNNQCSPDSSKWIRLITQYLDRKLELKTPLFDQLICAFKIENRKVELKRTTHQKTYTDLIRCTLLPKSTEICFIDNSYYSKMLNDRVYYIQPKSYIHSLSHNEIIDRFLGAHLMDCQREDLVKLFSTYREPIHIENQSADFIVSQKIMYHLKDFFLLTTKKQKTRKVAVKLGKFTRKRRNTESIAPPSP